MPRASVIVPTYNRGDALGRAIESVLRQELEDLELIVVDDCSTDDTESVVESYDDPRVRYLRHETNRGGSAARNTGIEHASGEYVAFLDDDDEYHPLKLTRQVECLERRSDEWVAAYCDYTVVRENDSPVDLFPSFFLRWWRADSVPHPEGGAELIPQVLSHAFPLGGASTLLVDGDALNELGGFDPEFPRHQDVEFLIRLLKTGKLAYVDEPLVRRYDTGRPSMSDVEKAKELLRARFSAEIADAERNGYDITGIHRFDLARFYFANGQFREGARHLRGAKIRPRELVHTLFIGTHQRIVAD
jgi:GT2 family glycosyltransferase